MKPIPRGTACFLVNVCEPHQDFEGRVVTVESGPALDPEDGVERYTTSATWWGFEIYAPRHRLLPIAGPTPIRDELRDVEVH